MFVIPVIRSFIDKGIPPQLAVTSAIPQLEIPIGDAIIFFQRSYLIP